MRLNAEQASKRTMRRSTGWPFRGRLTRLGYRAKPSTQLLRRNSGDSMYTKSAVKAGFEARNKPSTKSASLDCSACAITSSIRAASSVTCAASRSDARFTATGWYGSHPSYRFGICALRTGARTSPPARKYSGVNAAHRGSVRSRHRRATSAACPRPCERRVDQRTAARVCRGRSRLSAGWDPIPRRGASHGDWHSVEDTQETQIDLLQAGHLISIITFFNDNY